jgi:hypothetical protein
LIAIIESESHHQKSLKFRRQRLARGNRIALRDLSIAAGRSKQRERAASSFSVFPYERTAGASTRASSLANSSTFSSFL